MLGLLVLAVAPAVFILWYLYRKDYYEPEPLRLVLMVFLLGGVSVIPAAVIEYPFPSGIITSSVVAPFVEEMIKFCVVFFFVYRLSEFDEPVDGMMYAAAAGLGFAAVENIFYVLEGGIAVGVLRAVASVPGHMIFSCIWGFALGTAKFREGSARGSIIIAGLAGAIVLHGIFNFSLEVYEGAGLVFILVLVIPLGLWYTRQNIKKAHADPASAFSLLQRSSVTIARQLPGNSGIGPVSVRSGTQTEAPNDSSEYTGIDKVRKAKVHYCTSCGTHIVEGKKFCRNCGKEL
ncbi:MAG: PrsW family glutamic-type intramembrane protease [Methanoregula sp.]|nr:PrsW family glutamic-type intramembrane protease [Methanoregula sp.]